MPVAIRNYLARVILAGNVFMFPTELLWKSLGVHFRDKANETSYLSWEANESGGSRITYEQIYKRKL